MEQEAVYRARTAQLRKEAAQTQDGIIKVLLLALADEFDLMAEPERDQAVGEDDRFRKTIKRILYVEDDADVRSVSEQILVGGGYAVDTTGTVLAAEQLLLDRRYDLVVTDGRLPDGLGTMLADQAAAKGIPTIIVTGYAFKLLEDDPGIDLSRYNLLLKPLRPSELLEAVAEALGAREDESAADAPV